MAVNPWSAAPNPDGHGKWRNNYGETLSSGFGRQLAKTRLDFEFVEGVDGRELDLGNRSLIHPDRVFDDSFRRGAAGCALSHLRVYRKVLE